jgi:agmatine/peptidylarginine deiminase
MTDTTRPRVSRTARFIQLVVATTVCLALLLLGFGLRAQYIYVNRPLAPQNVMPAEFEPYDTLLLAWDNGIPDAEGRTLIRIAQETWDRVNLTLLVPNEASANTVRQQLASVGVPESRVQLVQVPFERCWIRDFGPQVVKSFDGQLRILDSREYHGGGAEQMVCGILGYLWQLPVDELPLVMDGGNLLSNGAGVLVTSTAVYEWNREAGNQVPVDRVLQESYGGREIVALEAMRGDPCEHVDSFCTFVSRDTIVVGQYDANVDPVNAALLDRNARRLAQVQTAGGKLNVVRIPMPPRKRHPPPYEKHEFWYTYTNVVFANGKLLVPTYKDVHPLQQAAALDVYRRLLPDWEIVGIPADSLLIGNGALHCATLNVVQTKNSLRLQPPLETPFRQ